MPEGIIQSFAHPTFAIDIVMGVPHGGIVSPGIAWVYLPTACVALLAVATTVFRRGDVS